MIQILWAACLATFIMTLADSVGEPMRPGEKTTYRIGVYDPRAIAVAFAGSEHFNQWMSGLYAEYKKAKAAGELSICIVPLPGLLADSHI
jgi:hypothetical protein